MITRFFCDIVGSAYELVGNEDKATKWYLRGFRAQWGKDL